MNNEKFSQECDELCKAVISAIRDQEKNYTLNFKHVFFCFSRIIAISCNILDLPSSSSDDLPSDSMNYFFDLCRKHHLKIILLNEKNKTTH